MKILHLLLCLLLTCTISVKAQQKQAQTDLRKEIKNEIKTMQKADQVPGLSVVVVQGNHVVLCEGFGTANLEKEILFDKNTVGRLASATKFFTSLGVLAAAEKGIINLNDQLSKYLSDVPATWKNLPLWRLLNLTSGIPGTESTPFDKMSDEQQRKINEHDLFEMLNKLPLDYQPGTKWSYRQTGYMIVAMIICEKTGKSWPDYLKETIFDPAGMTSTQHNDLSIYAPGLEPNNYVYNNDGKLVNSPFFFPLALSTGAGYNTTASDLCKLFLAINNHKVLSPEIIRHYEMVKEWMYPLGQGQFYSIASEIKPFGKYLTVGHSGGPDLANIRYSPDKKIGVAILVNRNTTGIGEDLMNRILQKILMGIDFRDQSVSVGYAVRTKVHSLTYDQLVRFYQNAKTDKRYHFKEEENDLNIAGYELLNSRHFADALKIFKLIVKEYPMSANAYDSLGEAYLKSGNKELALVNYKKSVALNPENENAKKIINSLEQ